MIGHIDKITVWYSEVARQGKVAIDTSYEQEIWLREDIDTYMWAEAVYEAKLKGWVEIAPFFGRDCWGYVATRVQ